MRLAFSIVGTREMVVTKLPYRLVYEIEREVLRVLDVTHTSGQ